MKDAIRAICAMPYAPLFLIQILISAALTPRPAQRTCVHSSPPRESRKHRSTWDMTRDQCFPPPLSTPLRRITSPFTLTKIAKEQRSRNKSVYDCGAISSKSLPRQTHPLQVPLLPLSLPPPSLLQRSLRLNARRSALKQQPAHQPFWRPFLPWACQQGLRWVGGPP